MLPLIKSALGIRSEPHDGWYWLPIFVDYTFHWKKSIEYALPFAVKVITHFILVPSRFTVALGHRKEYAVNETVGGSLAIGKLSEHTLLNCPDNWDERTLDEDGVLTILSVRHSSAAVESWKPELFFWTGVVACEVFEPCRQLIYPKA